MSIRKKRKRVYNFFILAALTFMCSLVMLFLSENKSLIKKAARGTGEISFEIISGKRLNKFWSNFAQGGEEQGLMLNPAAVEIRKLQPEYIRIDHLFDFGSLEKKDAKGGSFLDFSSIDSRVDEIINLGAKPFLSLSYFPSFISPQITTMPPSLDSWKKITGLTIQKYSGKNYKNLSRVYYEVWNEPDLFGTMTPEQYFQLYKSTVEAGNKCSNCNQFKIGGPAITTLKKDWMNSFLKLVKQNNLRMDFVSFHSYQIDPEKTLWEVNELKKLTFFPVSSEVIISEWGSIPEMSLSHDSFSDASHTIKAILILKNSNLNKLFAFELKDGPDPEGRQYWGRWGLLTHENFGLSPKPRYYSFLYLDRLLDYEITPIVGEPEISTIGSSDGKTNYSFVLANNSGQENIFPLKLTLNQLPPGKYVSNFYIYDKTLDPQIPQGEEITLQSGGVFNLDLASHAICLFELSRITASLAKAEGESQQPYDMSARVDSSGLPLIYPLNRADNFRSGKISFSFKQLRESGENRKYYLFENGDGKNSFSAWIEKSSFLQYLHLKIPNSNEELKTTISNIDDGGWHHFSFYFDKDKKIYGLKYDSEQSVGSLNNDFNLGNLIFIGSNLLKNNFSEGLIDNLEISLNNNVYYSENFNEEPAGE